MDVPGPSSVIDALSQLSASATVDLSSVLDASTDNFEDDIPTVTELPTLDSILNEETDEAPTVDELGLRDVLDDESITATPSFTDSNQSRDYLLEGSILRHSTLQGISNQLTRPNVRTNCGLPTALAAGVYRVIGTSRGVALIFDSKEQLKNILIPYQPGKKYDEQVYGAVSALDLLHDGTRLLIGHSKGLITHWDLENNKLLRFIDDAHPPGFAVLNLRFTDDPSVILFSNSGGHVFFLKFKRGFTGVRSWSSECFFSGSNGEAFTFEPLKLEGMPNHPLKEHCIVAVATVTQTIIISIAPKLEGLLSIPLGGKPNSLPLLAWQFVLVEQKDDDKTESNICPVLATTRDDVIHYVQLDVAPDNKPTFKLLKKIKVNYTLAAFKWINAQIVVAMDTTERIHLMTVRDNSEIEILDLKEVELVYGCSFYKSIETGGNVSPALVAASEYACYNSIVSSSNKLLILGLQTVHKISIKSWKERLASLVKENRFTEAIELGLQFYEGKAKAVVGLSGPIKKRKEAVMDQVIDILQGYIDIKLIVNKPTNIPEKNLQAYYQTLTKIAFETCLRMEKLDLLFGPLYETFRGEGMVCKGVFLDTLYRYVIDKKVTSVRTPVAKELIEHYKSDGNLMALQQCILNIDAQCLDIHYTVELCWSHQLYDAMFYVYNNGLHDYITPLLELLLQLRVAMKRDKTLSEHYQKVGYKLLVYIRCCLSGLAYPSGSISPEKQLLAKTSIFETLLAVTNTHNPNDKTSYPHLHTLLEFDAREFLNVLAFAFEEAIFDEVQGGIDLPGIPSRQTIVDILLGVMLQGQHQAFSPSQIGALFIFLARQGAKHYRSIKVDEHIYDQVLAYITKTDEDVINEERQQAVMELWHAGVLKKFDEERLLIMAESARFYRLCELLYEKKRQFGKVLSCYFRDPHRRHQAFSYIHQLMSDDQYNEIDKEDCSRAILHNIDILLKTDVKSTAQLIVIDFPLEISEITHSLQDKPDLQFEFLKGIFDPKNASRQDIQPPSHVVEKYIDLLCQYQPEYVYNFLRTNDSYRLEEALDICAMARVKDSVAYLLERTGDIKGAFKIILDTFKAELDSFGEKFVGTLLPSPEFQSQKEKVEHILQALLQLCQRTSSKVDETTRESMWLSVFDFVLSESKKFSETQNQQLQDAFKAIRSDVLNSVMGYIKLPEILQKIIENLNSGQFKDIKPILLRMLDTYNYEEILLQTTNHLLVNDVQQSLTNLSVLSHQSVTSDSGVCCLCDRAAAVESVDGTVDDVIVFNCNHLYHSSCLGVTGPSIGVTCLICDKSTKPSVSRQPLNNPLTASWDKNNSKGMPKSNKVQLDNDQLRKLQILNHTYGATAPGGYDMSSSISLRLAPPQLET